PFADAVKLFTKERVEPIARNRLVFIVAPRVMLSLRIVMWRVLPLKCWDSIRGPGNPETRKRTRKPGPRRRNPAPLPGNGGLGNPVLLLISARTLPDPLPVPHLLSLEGSLPWPVRAVAARRGHSASPPGQGLPSLRSGSLPREGFIRG
ncbi:unnamed protein product, partial [Cyprideis torosa]